MMAKGFRKKRLSAEAKGRKSFTEFTLSIGAGI